MLDGICSGVLYVLDDTGILFDALLPGAGLASGMRDGDGERTGYGEGSRVLAVDCWMRGAAAITILVLTRGIAAPGDISAALKPHPGAYLLSLGHMEDLTLSSFAYLRLPLLLAALAFGIGAVGAIAGGARRAFVAAVLMMVLFFHAARWPWWRLIRTCRRGRWPRPS